MQKYISIAALCCLCLCSGLAVAQDSVNSTGGNAQGASGSASWSIGQVFYKSSEDNNGWSSHEGVQQPWEFFPMHQPLIHQSSYRIYPNPGHSVLYWELETKPTKPVYFEVLDASGRLVHQGNATEKITQIPVSQWAAGSYFLQWSKDQQLITTKLLKH